nr:elastin isoform X43 [Oryctolagus cuniculus]
MVWSARCRDRCSWYGVSGVRASMVWMSGVHGTECQVPGTGVHGTDCQVSGCPRYGVPGAGTGVHGTDCQVSGCPRYGVPGAGTGVHGTDCQVSTVRRVRCRDRCLRCGLSGVRVSMVWMSGVHGTESQVPGQVFTVRTVRCPGVHGIDVRCPRYGVPGAGTGVHGTECQVSTVWSARCRDRCSQCGLSGVRVSMVWMSGVHGLECQVPGQVFTVRTVRCPRYGVPGAGTGVHGTDCQVSTVWRVRCRDRCSRYGLSGVHGMESQVPGQVFTVRTVRCPGVHGMDVRCPGRAFMTRMSVEILEADGDAVWEQREPSVQPRSGALGPRGSSWLRRHASRP